MSKLRHYSILIIEYSGEGLSTGHNQELETFEVFKAILYAFMIDFMMICQTYLTVPSQ